MHKRHKKLETEIQSPYWDSVLSHSYYLIRVKQKRIVLRTSKLIILVLFAHVNMLVDLFFAKVNKTQLAKI